MDDYRYVRGAEDMREFVARMLEAVGNAGLAAQVRTISPITAHDTLALDDVHVRRRLEREVAHTKALWRDRTARHVERKQGPARLRPLQIYIMKELESGLLKIGVSRDPEGRLRQIERARNTTIRLLHYAPGSHAQEQGMHARFAASRVAGEWFKPTPALVALAEARPSVWEQA